MRKSEFIKSLADECKLSQRDCEKVVEAMTPVIVEECVEKGGEISLPFGKFKQKINPAKKGNNPLTGTPLDIPESHTLGFKPSKTIKVVIEPKKAAKKK